VKLVDDKDFFREATLRMCSSLDIDKALWETCFYIRQYIPADNMFICRHHPGVGTGAAEIITKASEHGGERVSLKTTLPQETYTVVEGWMKNPHSTPQLYNTDCISKHTFLRFLSALLEDPDAAYLAIGPKPEWNMICGLFIGNSFGEKYSEEHERLFALLRDPFVIAVSNYLRYQEVLRLQDILLDDNRYLRDELRQQAGEDIVGGNFGLKHVMEMVDQVASLSSPVLLRGETGVGKEVIATAIHNLSPRKNGPLIKVNCGAIPDSLMDSELFGHEKGAFTGALFQKRGRFERAHGGTILLDEIGELTLGAQVRLLRVLQDKEIERLGGVMPISVDTRVIAATHRNLEGMLAEGKFREDLYFRLNVFPITIPPLRERRADIPMLVQHFMMKKSREMGLAKIPSVTPGSIDVLLNYHWPGNVRELQNVVERALILNKNKPLVFENLSDVSRSSMPSIQPVIIGEDSYAIDQCISRHIRQVLEITGGQVEGERGAAKLLMMNPSTLRTKMKKMGIPFGRKSSYKK
jgi:transcriptional regulator with GAF, ATPase, and Fis domain